MDPEYECITNPSIRESPNFEANKKLYANMVKKKGFFRSVWEKIKTAFVACKEKVVSWAKNPLLWVMVVGMGLGMLKA